MPGFTLRLHSFLIAISLVGVASPIRADNWGQFRGPNGDGISKDKNVPIKFGVKENVLWKIALIGDGHSSPIVWGDHLFIQTNAKDGNERSLVCLDANTGKEHWKRSIPARRAKVRFDSSLASATPATDGEAVYVPFWDGKDIILTAFSFKGEKLWDRNLGEFISQHGAGASPIIYKDLLFFSMDKDAFRDTTKKTGAVPNPSTLYAFDKKSGKTVWEMPRDAVRACYTAPTILERPGSPAELIVASTSAITSYVPETGKVKWNWKWNFPGDPLRTIAGVGHTDGVLIACSGDGSGDRLMVGVDLKGTGKDAQPKQLWANSKKRETPYVPGPIIHGEHVYYANDVGDVACMAAKTGKIEWTHRLPGAKFYASPIMIDGKIYACTDQGDMFVFAADTKGYQPLAKNALASVVRATPAVANGRLYIRTQDSLFCIGTK